MQIPLKQGEDKLVDVIIRPYSINFIDMVAHRYNIILLTKANKYVRKFDMKFFFKLYEQFTNIILSVIDP